MADIFDRLQKTLARSDVPERFEREIRLAASLLQADVRGVAVTGSPAEAAVRVYFPGVDHGRRRT